MRQPLSAIETGASTAANHRPFVHKKDIALFGALVFAALLAYLFFVRPERNIGAVYGQIAVDGRVVKNFALTADNIFSIEQNPHLRFEVKNGAAAFIASDCPDKICVRTGFLSRAGQTAVCLPNKVSLRIVGAGEPDEADAAVR
ncbi:MAG: NusG domain II-containing protein [Clostridiales bacterium]|jgi:hypothetical protein|nr:NusG domain II-containing protein [Clostridiales bacterium]